MIYNILKIGFFIFGILLVGCQQNPLPKPKAMLRLEYETPKYDTLITHCPFSFEKNENSVVTKELNCSLNIEYTSMKATIYLTYKPIKNDLATLLRDAQKLTYEHFIKASNIVEQPYVNAEKRVFGMFYEVDGNAASQSQFYVTDSLNHFLTGSIYFKVKPNFDSIQPAASYLKNDIRHIMESLHWKK